MDKEGVRKDEHVGASSEHREPSFVPLNSDGGVHVVDCGKRTDKKFSTESSSSPGSGVKSDAGVLPHESPEEGFDGAIPSILLNSDIVEGVSETVKQNESGSTPVLDMKRTGGDYFVEIPLEENWVEDKLAIIPYCLDNDMERLSIKRKQRELSEGSMEEKNNLR